MTSVREATISGFNEYLQTLKKDAKSAYEFTLTLFDTSVYRPTVAEKIRDVENLDARQYNPSGGTALYDAVCSTIRGINMTDGEENSSKEHTEKNMKALIKEREAKGNWTFVYLGANQDSYAVAQKYGFAGMNVSNFNATGKGISNTMRAVANNTVMYSAQATSSSKNFFSAQDQDDLDKTK